MANPQLSNGYTKIANELLEAIATISGTTEKLKRKGKNVPKIPAQHIKKPPINFKKCGIPIGAELVFTEDPTVKVTVVRNCREIICSSC